LALAGESDYLIEVEGVLRLHGGGAPGIGVQLFAGNPEDACSGSPHATSDRQGQFSFTHRVPRSWRETFVVVVRTFRLCVRQKEEWMEVWAFRSGPPPKRLVFDCELSSPSGPVCHVHWDGRPLE